jgi:hypothetical protein
MAQLTTRGLEMVRRDVGEEGPPHRPDLRAAITKARGAGPDDPRRLRIGGRCCNPFCFVRGLILLIDDETPLRHPRFMCPGCRRSLAVVPLTADGEPIVRTPVR